MTSHVGDAGENRFAEICNRAGITANRSEVDRFGWDYLVEFSKTGKNFKDGDAPQILKKAFVQIKSTAVDRKFPSGTIASFKKLVDIDIPCFIGRVIYSSMDEEASLQIAHVGTAMIEQILMAARKAGVDGKKLNEACVSISVEEFANISRPSELLEFLDKNIDSNLAEYALNKSKIRNSCGERKIEINFRFDPTITTEEINAHTLDGGPPLRILDAQIVSKRFDIEIEQEQLSAGILTINPTEVETVEVFFEGEYDGAGPFKCDLVVSPLTQSVKISHNIFSLRLNAGKGSGKFKIDPNFNDELSAPDLLENLRLIKLLRDGDFIRVVVRRGEFSGIVTFNCLSEWKFPVNPLISLCEMLARGWKKRINVQGSYSVSQLLEALSVGRYFTELVNMDSGDFGFVFEDPFPSYGSKAVLLAFPVVISIANDCYIGVFSTPLLNIEFDNNRLEVKITAGRPRPEIELIVERKEFNLPTLHGLLEKVVRRRQSETQVVFAFDATTNLSPLASPSPIP